MTAPTNPESPYHFSLTDGTNTVGLKLCDERGHVSPFMFTADSNPTTSLKVAQGGGDSDFELPFTPISIGDWSGGRGQEDHERDATRYSDSTGIDTTGSDILLGPRPTAVNIGLSVAGGGIFFTFMGALCLVTQPADESGSRMFVNGYLGKVSAPDADKTKVVTNLNLSGVNLAGKVVRLMTYPGVQEEQNWRVIASNTTTGTNDTITVATAFRAAITTDTYFVVEGCDTWGEVTGHGFADATYKDPVTAVAVVNTIVYCARGDNLKIRRFRYTGTWEFADDDDGGGVYGSFLRLIAGADGKRKIWRVRRLDGLAWKADVVAAWGTSLTWSASNGGVAAGAIGNRCSGIVAYDSPQQPYLLLEGSIGSINNDVYGSIPLAELENIHSAHNGRASMVQGVYLYFNLREGIQRYYNQHMDSVGPNLGDGLPEWRRGPVVAMVAYPGRYCAAVSPGTRPSTYPTLYASVLVSVNDRWCEIYRSSNSEYITALAIQCLEGAYTDRLWLIDGTSLVWLPVSAAPRKHGYYTYAANGSLESSWIYTSFRDLPKYFHSLKLLFEKPTNTTIYVDYKVDKETNAWTALPTAFTTEPSQEVLLSSTYNVTGKRIKFRFRLATTDAAVSPRIKGVVVEGVTRVPAKRTWNVAFVLQDAPQYNLAYQEQFADLDTVMAQLESWSDPRQAAAPLTLSSIYSAWTGKRVFINQPTYRVVRLENQSSGFGLRLVGRTTITEVA